MKHLKTFESFDHPDAFEHGMDSSKIEKIIRAAETKGLIELSDQLEYVKTQVDDLEEFKIKTLAAIVGVLGYDEESAAQLLNELENYDIDRLEDDESIVGDLSESLKKSKEFPKPYDKDFLSFTDKDITAMLKAAVEQFDDSKVANSKYSKGTMTMVRPIGNDGHYNIDFEITEHPANSPDLYPPAKYVIYSVDFRYKETDTDWNSTQPIIKVKTLKQLKDKALVADIMKYIEGKKAFKKTLVNNNKKKVNEAKATKFDEPQNNIDDAFDLLEKFLKEHDIDWKKVQRKYIAHAKTSFNEMKPPSLVGKQIVKMEKKFNKAYDKVVQKSKK